MGKRCVFYPSGTISCDMDQHTLIEISEQSPPALIFFLDNQSIFVFLCPMTPKKHTYDDIINQIRNIPAERLPVLYDLIQGFLQGQKRDYARKQLSGEVDLVIHDKVYKQQMQNISASGVFVRMKGEFTTGTKVRFVIDLPETKNTLKLTGHITRVENFTETVFQNYPTL